MPLGESSVQPETQLEAACAVVLAPWIREDSPAHPGRLKNLVTANVSPNTVPIIIITKRSICLSAKAFLVTCSLPLRCRSLWTVALKRTSSKPLTLFEVLGPVVLGFAVGCRNRKQMVDKSTARVLGERGAGSELVRFSHVSFAVYSTIGVLAVLVLVAVFALSSKSKLQVPRFFFFPFC